MAASPRATARSSRTTPSSSSRRRPEHWRLPMTRWVTGTRPDQDGRFKVQNLPAGNYLAVAVDYVPQGEWGDPELLDRLKSKAKRFTLGDGATHTLDLKLSDF